MSKSISFELNGKVETATCRPDMTVLEWLRGEALLRGTKEGCAEGDCGACSVLVKRVGDKKHISANSCIMLMGQMEGGALLTVEGLAASGPDGHVIQKLMAENGSSQCGYCTPGIVTSLAGLLDTNKNPDETEIHDALAGNLCRCTGYRPIVEAAEAAARANPAELPAPKKMDAETMVGLEGCHFFLPTSLKELLKLRASKPEAVLLAGGTDLSLDVAHAKARWDETILIRNVTELRAIEETKSHITFGGAVTWQSALPLIQKHWPSFATLVRRFGSTQIRSMGTIAGNLGNASPIGDGAPALLALDASLTLANKSGEREIALSDFFLSYRKSALKADEIIRSISVPLPTKNTQFRTYKISKRYDQDISTVCGAFALEMDGGTITKARIAYGGMAATSMRCEKAEAQLVGNQLDTATIAAVQKTISEVFSPMSDMRGTAKYRATVAANLLDRLALDLAGETIEVMAL